MWFNTEALVDVKDPVLGITRLLKSEKKNFQDRLAIKYYFRWLNALKFHRPGIAPNLRISSQTVDAKELPPTIKPIQRTRLYHRIDVRDNGIGFEEKYLDRIFQILQRLHGKNQYSGSHLQRVYAPGTG